jgi:hypothetical protein
VNYAWCFRARREILNQFYEENLGGEVQADGFDRMADAELLFLLFIRFPDELLSFFDDPTQVFAQLGRALKA